MRVAEPQLDAAIAPAEGVLVRRSWQKHLLTFFMVFGPGLIVMEADNDAGAVSTYMQAGGQYGLHLLWLLVVLLPICYFVQEMVARLGIATGKGHAAMIYERFGKWWGRFSLLDLLAVNFLTLITEFAAISLALSALGVSPWISVPVSAIFERRLCRTFRRAAPVSATVSRPPAAFKGAENRCKASTRR